MLIARIDGATRVLAESQEEYNALPIRDVPTDGGNIMQSAWKPTPDEIRRINAGESIYLSIWGWKHPPVLLTVGGV